MGEGEGGDIVPKNVTSSDAAAATNTSPLDAPTKKLARQLDFTAFPGHSPSQSQLHLQPQQQKVAQPPVVVTPVPPPSLLPQTPIHPSVRVGKPESPKSRSRPNLEMKDGTPKKQKQCNCKHSKCLKL